MKYLNSFFFLTQFLCTWIFFFSPASPAYAKTPSNHFIPQAWLVNIPEGTRVFIVNPFDSTQKITVHLFSLDGVELNEFSWTLNPKSRLIWETPHNATGSQTLCFSSTGNLLIDAVWQEGDSLFEQKAAPAHASPLYLPHIAEQTQYWETTASWATQAVCRFSLKTNQLETLLPNQNRFSTYQVDLEPYLNQEGNPSSEVTAWRSLETLGAKAAGSFSFRNKTGSQGASLPIHFVKDTYLILPHIPSDEATWWTGLVLLNPGWHSADVEITWYSSVGSQVTTRVIIESGKRLSGLLAEFSDGVPADWAEIRSSQPLLGFELFGTRNEQSLCGIPLTNKMAKKHLFTRTGEADTWSGVSVLNPGGQTLELSMTQYSDHGVALRTDPMQIPAKSRIRFIPESDFPTSEPSWLEITSDQGFMAFQLTGKQDQTGLSALSGLPLSNRELQLNYSRGFGIVPDPRHTSLVYDNLTGVGDKEFLIADQEGISIFSNLHENELNSPPENHRISYEELGFEAEGPLPPNLSVQDLNQDGLQEILILDLKLHLYTLHQDGSMVRFQSQLPVLEGADQITGYADINRDGFIDILTGRGLYKSLASLANPYFTNYFPFQLQTSGRASRFVDLNADGTPDLLTSLFESFYGFIPNASLDQLGTPLFTPDPSKTIVSAFLKDMTGDGSQEVIYLLGNNSNSQYASDLQIASIGWEDSQLIADFPLPDDLAIGFLEQIETGPSISGYSQKVLLKQELNHCTRLIEVSLDGIESISYQTGFGAFDDFNADGLLDQVAPWALGLTQPNGRITQPAFLYFDENQASNLSGLYKSPNNHAWISYIELSTGSASKVEIWEEKGFKRNREKTWSLNLPVGIPSYLELVDYDHDGDRDIMVAGAGLTVYPFEEQGYSVSPIFLHSPSIFTIDNARKCDLNGNEFPDLLGNPISGEPYMKIVFDYTSDHPQSLVLDYLGTPWQIELCDLNQDGLHDLLVNNNKYPPVALINNADNTFSTLTLPSVFKMVTAMDINGSGKQDLIAFVPVPDLDRSYLRLYKNEGDLNFSLNINQQIFPSEPYRRILSVDVNQDGRPDLLAFDQNDESIMDIWINEWSEENWVLFFLSGSTPTYGAPGAGLWDLDTDGNLDLEMKYNGTVSWRLNRTNYFKQPSLHPESGGEK